MAQHILSLEAPDTMNKCILRIVDTSIYSSDIPVSCPILLITPPGFNTSVQFIDAVTVDSNVIIEPGFILNLTACDLDMQVADCGTEYSDLPDGLYAIKYSVSPNDTVYVEYNHLRITKALYRYQEILCDLDLGACEPSSTVSNTLSKLKQIRMYLAAAKAQAEFCHQANKAMDLYSYALKQLDKIECTTCNT